MLSLTPAILEQFTSLTFIRNAIKNPCLPSSVLSFYLGKDSTLPASRLEFRDGGFMTEMSPYWFGANPEYDKLCQNFSPIVRKAGQGLLDSEEEWQTMDGKVSRIILCDQLARNCFRGTPEAFAYDNVARDIARDLTTEFLSSISADDFSKNLKNDDNEVNDNDYNKMNPTFAIFCVLSMMHSEILQDHELCLRLIDWAKVRSGYMWDFTRKMTKEHYEVIKKFGRYPHRNSKLNRTSTKEEIDWLASDEVPIWAKSQD